MNMHRRPPIFVTLAIIVWAVNCGNTVDVPEGDKPVATVDGTLIRYRQIRCPARERTVPTRCVPIEQSSLRTRIYEYAIESAAHDLGIALGDADLASVEEHVRLEHGRIVIAANHMEAVLRAVVRVHKGESVAVVQQDAAAAGVQPAELTESLNFYPTPGSAEEALAVDFVGTGDKNVRGYYRRALLIPRIRSIVEDRARAQNVAFAVAESQMWREVIASHRIRILDDRYQMPDFIDVLGVKEETIHVVR
jgi:hypothetical protein